MGHKFCYMVICFSSMLITVLGATAHASDAEDYLPFGKVCKYDKNPILRATGTKFESMAVFNSTAILVNDTVYLFYRSENWGMENWNPANVRPKGWTWRDEWPGVSTIGMATSKDGINFTRSKKPAIAPDHDYEQIGGCEDPRITKIDDFYYMTYTGVGLPNRVSKLCLATSKDLVNWEKHGPILKGWDNGNNKSGAILPKKINGKYWMYFGCTNIWLASSEDGIHWKSDINKDVVLRPRKNHFDSALCESGPSPVFTDKGILLIYNGAADNNVLRMVDYGNPSVLTASKKGDRKYATGWALFSKDDPSKLIARSDKPILEITEDFEKRGQVNNVLFSEGLVLLNNKWHIYYGCADTYIGVATAENIGTE
ncbi:MAG TPA: glycoside hydrolase family 130 protein [Victivallales bacterium]|nr:glycoside hydrolase family 130 protein [Victivallales bacterium]